MQEALHYKKLDAQKVKCELCPWNCELVPGQTGICKVRANENGMLITLVYNRVAALGTDPIEKKPLYHFHPGKNILSIGMVGCNLRCTFCQNHRISQCFASEFTGFHNIHSEKIVSEALKTWKNIGIAYTYNEPFTFYEFLLDTAVCAHKKGLKNVVVSNGYINPEPLKNLIPYISAFNIDLKSYSENFYTTYTKGKLHPVMDTLKTIAESKTHLEITNLVIPTLNDSENEFTSMVKWIATELGPDIPLHLSRYFPQHKLQLPPTPLKTLEKLYSIAKEYLHHVYLGNVSDAKRSSTFCHNCGELLIERNRYSTEVVNLSLSGNCESCNMQSKIQL